MLQVYLRDEPRAIVLATSTSDTGDETKRGKALVLGVHGPASREKGEGSSRPANESRATIELVSSAALELNTLQKLQDRAFGCLGLMNVGDDLFVGVITGASTVGDPMPGKTVMKVTSVVFYCLNSSLWDEAPLFRQGGPLDPQGPLPLPHEPGYTPSRSAPAEGIVEHPCAAIKRLMSNGTFYFAKDASFNLAQSLGTPGHRSHMDEKSATDTEESNESGEGLGDGVDSRFVWNTYLMTALHDYRSRLDTAERRSLDAENYFVLLIQGYVGAAQVGSATFALVSRLSWKRAGTRYAIRGIDDDGNVANFAESETLYTCDDTTFSFLQVRGSVPLFWEQQGLQAFNARIQITRSRLASQPAFDRHFVDLLKHYQHVHALNLLGQRDAEVVLTNAYAEQMRNSEAVELYLASLSKEDGVDDQAQEGIDRIGLTNFDFHSVARMNGGLDAVSADLKRLNAVRAKRDAFGFTLVSGQGEVLQQQHGVFRVNCLDCLDRTNVVQGVLSQEALQSCITTQGLRDLGSTLWSQHRSLWAENGDALSRIYAGTGALNSDFTRTGIGKKTLGGLLSDAAKSASRLYINNFQDKSKQGVIDALLGNMAEQRAVSVFDPVHDAVSADMNERLDEFSSIRNLNIFVATWNLAGRSPSGESLAPLLFASDCEVDVYAIGLQEVVPLTAQQILLTDPEQLRYWERTLIDAFTRRPGKHATYVPLRSEQLVGTALLIYVKEELLPHVRQVEASTRKTGLKGMSGNKGGVAIRMNIYDTSFCFVTAHFAAGKANVEERNADFHTINRNLSFNGGRGINNSHHTFWLGDFNYRIDGGNEIVRPLCERADIGELIARDQLNRAREAGQAFSTYAEGMLTFLPTYKYDFNSRSYDTSEKYRVPAWTDRILHKSQYPFKNHQFVYDRAELLTSDHRPVFALYEADARQYDKSKRNALRRQLLMKHKARQNLSKPELALSIYGSDDETASTPLSELTEGYDTDELPPPSSSDGAKSWWDEPLSGEEDNNLENEGFGDQHNGRVESENPFARHSEAQFARRLPSNQSRSLLPKSSSTKSFSPSPLALSAASTRSPFTQTSSPASASSSDVTDQQARRAAPPPPKLRPPLEPSSISTGKISPPIPVKPSRLSEGRAPSTRSDVTIKVSSEDPPIPSQPPKVPMRPSLGLRSESYQSGKSQRSLIDNSD